MIVQAAYRQRAEAWLNLLLPWWRVFGRGTVIKEVKGILESAQNDLQLAKSIYEVEYACHQETKTKYNDAYQQFESEQAQHETTRGQLKSTQGDIKAARKIFEAEFTRHKETKTKYDDTYRQLEKEKVEHGRTQDKLNDVLSRLDLITSILSAPNQEHSKYLAFQKLFREDFLQFANEENLYEREAEAILRLQAVENELRLLGRVPLFREKTIIAVAGGFSSGKSSLISSFFDTQFKVTLPIAVDPVTAIPTYIAHSTETAIFAFPAHGGTVAITPELFAKMQHKFLQALGFDLRRILPFVMLETPWRKPWGSLCFIDTPGYNPAKGGGTTAADDTTTSEALRQADALIWVLGIDANGEISSDDLNYLVEHGRDLPLAVVVNKADTRLPSQVQEVVEKIRDTLDGNCIAYHCISAYSSVERREYHYEGKPLDEFLGSRNRPTARDQHLRKEVTAVLDAYIKAFENEIKAYNIHKNELHSLKLDLAELGLFDEVGELSGISKDRRIDGVNSLHSNKNRGGVPANSTTAISRQNRIGNQALDRMDKFATLFTVEKIETHKKEAERLRNLMTRLLTEDW